LDLLDRKKIKEKLEKIDEKFHCLYPSLHIVISIKQRRTRWVGQVKYMTETINTYKILVGKPQRKDLRGAHMCR
jgi:hypothetical protein